MSDDLSAVHAQTSAIFEKLYDERGQPNELDDAFIQEYFNLVKDHVNLGAGEVGLLTEMSLSQQARGLIDVKLPRQLTFVASKLQAVSFLNGAYQIFGQVGGEGRYILSNVRGMIKITIKSDNAVVHFLGITLAPGSVTESGKGEWVNV